MSENLEQEKRKAGHETLKLENCGQRNFHRQNPPGLSEKPGLAETESDLLPHEIEVKRWHVRMSVPMTWKSHPRARGVEGIHRTTCPYSFIRGEA